MHTRHLAQTILRIRRAPPLRTLTTPVVLAAPPPLGIGASFGCSVKILRLKVCESRPGSDRGIARVPQKTAFPDIPRLVAGWKHASPEGWRPAVAYCARRPRSIQPMSASQASPTSGHAAGVSYPIAERSKAMSHKSSTGPGTRSMISRQAVAEGVGHSAEQKSLTGLTEFLRISPDDSVLVGLGHQGGRTFPPDRLIIAIPPKLAPMPIGACSPGAPAAGRHGARRERRGHRHRSRREQCR